MEMKILAKAAQKIFEGEGGMYYSWSNTDSPILADTKLGGGKLVLHQFGLALPHYADSSKVSHVLEGSGRVGVILPRASEEKVLNLKKGDIIPLPCGSISWWFNDANSDFTVVFLGETSKAYNAGEITYFFLAGTNSILHGLSTELLSKAWGLNEEDVTKITKSQTGVLIVKLKQSQSLPEPCKADTDKIVINTEKDENLVVVTSEELPLLKQVGLSTVVVKLQGNAIHAPEYLPDSSFQMIYIERGSGRFQVAGIDGKSVLDDMVEAGQLLVVPRFFLVSIVAGGEGMDCFSIITTLQPLFGTLAGRRSVWKALSPQVLLASLNISPELEERFRENMSDDGAILPTPN